jgi:4-alpha-glucanotransferase
MSDASAASLRPWLAQLAARVGIEERFHALDGQLRVTSDDTRVALLCAMGFAASDEASVRAEVQAWDAAAEARTVEPVSVILQGEPMQARIRPSALARASSYRLTLELEHGGRIERTGELDEVAAQAERSIELPPDLPLGYHRLECALVTASGTRCASRQLLIVAPILCAPPPSGATGIAAQLYSVRGEREHGAGDFRTLRELIDLCADAGAQLCALNPLCALDQTGGEVSPYSPTSRLALHPLYLDTDALLPSSASTLASSSATQIASPRIDPARVLAAKLAIARAQLAPAQEAALGSSPEAQARAAYARFALLSAKLGERDCRRFPEGLRTRDQPLVEPTCAEAADELEFQLALQLALEQQLEAVSEHGKRRGVGLVLDLPIGSVAGGADTWAHPGLFADGASLGAPPDDYSATGQSWGLAPIVPHASRAEGHAFLIAALRHAMRHARALRVDHVLGMRRQLWVPEGKSAAHGAYVRCPEREWFAILALESQRSGCAVLGEDLGTVPEGFRAELAACGILRTQVMWFERGPDGAFSDPASYDRLAVASATTHDLPPLRALWEGADLTQRHALGLLDDAALANAQDERERARHALYALLRKTGELPEHAHWPEHPELERMVHTALARAPSAILLLALDDLAGEREGVSIPGTGPELGNWRRRMSRSLPELRADGQLVGWVHALSTRRRGAY